MPKDPAITASQVAALLKPEAVLLDVQAAEKVPALRETAALLAGNAAVVDAGAFFREILARENTGNTALGNAVAIPHARTDQCREIVVAVGRSAQGIDYGAADGQRVRLIFLIGTPKHLVTEYLRVVGGLARILSRNTVCLQLLTAPDAPAFIRIIADAGK
jgi:mannitol/fructose-specific phosphotransferase system IIA component (Ntr-type)